MTNAVVPSVAANAPVPAPNTAATPPAEATENTVAASGEASEAAPPPDVLDAAGRAAKKAREDARRHREREAQANQTAAQVAAIKRENERLAQENKSFHEWRQGLSKDPYAALKQLGMTEEDLARRAITAGSPEEKIAQLHAQIEQERKDRKELEDRWNREKTDQIRSNAQKQLVEAANDEAKFPLLSQQPDEVIINQAYVTLQKIQSTIDPATGLPVDTSKMTYDDICYVLERLWEVKHSSKKKTAASNSKEPVTTPKESAAPEKKPSTNTLTNKLTSQKFVLPKNFEQLSDREQRKVMAEQLRASGMAK